MDNVILLCEYGSRAHGTNTEFSDHDKMGIYVEPIEAVLGIDHVGTVQNSTAPKGERSTKDDTDTTYYPLRKWATLAARGNPTAMTPLFVHGDHVESWTNSGAILRANAGLFVSKEAGRRYLGYMRGQRDAMTGARNKRTNRPELIHQFGYDVKFGYHMARTAVQGIELMTTGNIDLPMSGSALQTMKDIRSGKMSKDDLLALTVELENTLTTAIANADLPEHSDTSGINRLLIDIQTLVWFDGDL